MSHAACSNSSAPSLRSSACSSTRRVERRGLTFPRSAHSTVLSDTPALNASASWVRPLARRASRMGELALLIDYRYFNAVVDGTSTPRTPGYRKKTSLGAEKLARFERQMADYARGQLLVGLRERRHLSQEDAAYQIGVTAKSLRAWEHGRLDQVGQREARSRLLRSGPRTARVQGDPLERLRPHRSP